MKASYAAVLLALIVVHHAAAAPPHSLPSKDPNSLNSLAPHIHGETSSERAPEKPSEADPGAQKPDETNSTTGNMTVTVVDLGTGNSTTSSTTINGSKLDGNTTGKLTPEQKSILKTLVDAASKTSEDDTVPRKMIKEMLTDMLDIPSDFVDADDKDTKALLSDAHLA